MSVCLDTGVLAAHQNQRDAHHDVATAAVRAVASGRLGRPVITDYIIDETVTLVRMRTKSHSQALIVMNRMLGRSGFPKIFDVLMVTGTIFRRAVAHFEEFRDQPLSFTDATTIAAMRSRRLDHVLSFDRDFDGIVQRIDPRDLSERA